MLELWNDPDTLARRYAPAVYRLPWRKREGPLEDNVSAPEAPETGCVTQAVISLPARYRIPIHLLWGRTEDRRSGAPSTPGNFRSR